MAICDNQTNTEELVNFLGPSQAATQFQNSQDDLFDNLFESLASNVETCRCYETNFQFHNADTNNALMLMHINVLSLPKNFHVCHEFISQLAFTPDVTCISEIRIKNQPLVNIDLSNYSFHYVDSVTNAGEGGVAMYIHSSLNSKYPLNNINW